MLINEEDVVKFCNEHLNPASFDIDVREDGWYEKYVKGRSYLSYCPTLTEEEIQECPQQGDHFRGSPDMEFPVTYYLREDLEISDITAIKWVSLSGNSVVIFDRVNNVSFKVNVRKLTINSFKELVQFADSKEDVYALLVHL